MSKIRILLYVFLFVFVLIIARLLFIQVIDKDRFQDYLSTRRMPAERGKILDTNGAALVSNQLRYRLFMEPKIIQDAQAVTDLLVRELGSDPASIAALLQLNRSWVSVQTGLTHEQKERIERNKILGLGFDEMQSRYYPEGSISAHLVGFVGKNEKGEDTGYFGLEGFYDKDLVGLPGLMRSDVDLEGKPIFLGTQDVVQPENGRTLTLTIDRAVQRIVKTKLKEGLELYEAKEGCVVVVDPYTMAILSMVCLPDFDPLLYYNYSTSWYKNSAISDLYEPGSTFKPLVMAMAIERGLITPKTQFNEDGPVSIGEYSIRTWNNSYEGRISMTRALEKSSNTGMVFVGTKLGNRGVYDLLHQYGFGEVTGIDLQGEVSGLIKPMDNWYAIDFATATFGQGIAVTPIQMVRAFSTIVNGGNLMRPYVVKSFTGKDGTRTITPQVVRKVLSEKTAQQMKQMLFSTIENGETKWLKPKGNYAIGGKTGTAQIALKGTYDASKTIASFIGFAPLDKPTFLALVVVKEPKTSQWGSETAAPIFFEIAKELFVYYNISPK